MNPDDPRIKLMVRMALDAERAETREKLDLTVSMLVRLNPSEIDRLCKRVSCNYSTGFLALQSARIGLENIMDALTPNNAQGTRH